MVLYDTVLLHIYTRLFIRHNIAWLTNYLPITKKACDNYTGSTDMIINKAAERSIGFKLRFSFLLLCSVRTHLRNKGKASEGLRKEIKGLHLLNTISNAILVL
jgi:hypothetical protein